jgi:hypothetical protein
MSDRSLSDRQLKILQVVAEGAGDWDARRIDLTVDSRYGPGSVTVLRELEELERLGFVIRDTSRSGLGGRWAVADIAKPFLE